MQKLSGTFYLLFFMVPLLGFGQTYTAQNQVNVTIAQVQNITIAQASVNLPLTTTAQYVAGSSSGPQLNHIKVVSTATYQVSIRAQQSFLLFNGSSSSVPVSSIEVKTTAGTDLTGNGAPFSGATQIVPSVALSVTETMLIGNAPPEAGRGYNVTYVIPAANTTYYLNQPSGTYTTTIIYTLSAQ